MMKKLALSLLLALLTLSPLRLGAERWGRLLIGPTGGVSLSTVTFRPIVQQKPYLGYSGGVALRYDVESYAGVLVELNYWQRGWTEAPEDYPQYTYKRNLSFVHVPIMTHFMIGGAHSPLKLTIDAGSHFGYKLGESEEERVGEGFDPTTMRRVYREHHGHELDHNFWWGVGGGIGAEYHMHRFVIGLRGGYIYNLGELFDNSRTSLFGTSSEQVIDVRTYLLYRF